MSNIYEYKDYKTLLGDITSGNYVIHQPISVDNEPISFLGNLLCVTFYLYALYGHVLCYMPKKRV